MKEKLNALVRHARDSDLERLERIAHAHVTRAAMDHMEAHPPSDAVLAATQKIPIVKHLYRTITLEASAEFKYEGGMPFTFAEDLLGEALKKILSPQQVTPR